MKKRATEIIQKGDRDLNLKMTEECLGEKKSAVRNNRKRDMHGIRGETNRYRDGLVGMGLEEMVLQISNLMHRMYCRLPEKLIFATIINHHNNTQTNKTVSRYMNLLD